MLLPLRRLAGSAVEQRPRQPVGAAFAEQGSGLDERPHALLREERVALRSRDEHALEWIEAGVGPEQRAEELFGAV